LIASSWAGWELDLRVLSISSRGLAAAEALRHLWCFIVHAPRSLSGWAKLRDVLRTLNNLPVLAV